MLQPTSAEPVEVAPGQHVRLNLLAETGLDMERWRSAKAQDLGQRGSRVSRPYHPRAATTLTPTGGGRQRKRSVQPGEPQRPTQGRCSLAAGAGRHLGQQLGLHGDDVARVEHEGVVCTALADRRSLARSLLRRTAVAAAHGVSNLPVDGGQDPRDSGGRACHDLSQVGPGQTPFLEANRTLRTKQKSQ